MISARSAKRRCCLDLRGDHSLELVDFGGELLQKTRVQPFEPGAASACSLLSFQTGLQVDQALASLSPAPRVPHARHPRAWPGASLNVSANQAIISASIVSFFAKRPADSREVPNPLWIDNPHFDDRRYATPWPTHARSRHLPPSPPCRPGACEAMQSNSRRLPTRSSGRSVRSVSDPNASSTLSLATSIPTTIRSFCAIIQLPSLPGTGSKPLQLFGLRKTPELSLALFDRLCRLRAQSGSVPARAVLRTARSSHSGRFCRHKSAL